MKQVVANNKKTETSIKRIVSEKFFMVVKEAVASGLVKNEREFALLIGEDQAEFSKIKSPDGNRYVGVEALFKAANVVGVDANLFFVEGEEKKRNLLREGVQVKGGNVSGNNNVVLTGQAVSNHGDVYLNVEKLVQSLPAKDKNTILKKISNLESQNTGLNDQIEDLKKTIDRYEREMEKERELREKEKELREADKKLIEAQKKIIEMMEAGKGSKK